MSWSNLKSNKLLQSETPGISIINGLVCILPGLFLSDKL